MKIVRMVQEFTERLSVPDRYRTNLTWTARHRVILLFSLLLSVGLADTASANGVPVQVFLDHLPFKASWAPAGDARGVAVIHANEENVRVRAQDLPAPAPAQVYFAWLEKTEGGFLPVGPMTYSSDGTASIDQTIPGLPYSENFSWVLVSVEPAGGARDVPASDVALAGRLPNAQALPVSGNAVPDLLPVTGASADGPRTDAQAPATDWARIAFAFLLFSGLAVAALRFRALFMPQSRPDTIHRNTSRQSERRHR